VSGARLRPLRLLADLDRALFTALQDHRGARTITVARRVSRMAEPAVVYPGLAAAGAVSAWAYRSGWRAAVGPTVVVASGAMARHLLSQALARSRPPAEAWLVQPQGFSLPSRHVTLAALAAGASCRAFGVPGLPGKAVPLLAAGGVGVSRVCLGVHWPGDVLVAWLFAESWLRLTACCPNRTHLGEGLSDPEPGPTAGAGIP
jgi:membrane-associated phospholipid phosphatase